MCRIHPAGGQAHPEPSHWLEDVHEDGHLRIDIRLGVRMLFKNPWLTLVGSRWGSRPPSRWTWRMGGEALYGRGAVLLPAVCLLMATAGMLAALGPARRGLRIHPVEALRDE